MADRYQIVRLEDGVYVDVPGEPPTGNEKYARLRAYGLSVGEAFTTRREIGIYEINDQGQRCWLTDQSEPYWTRFLTVRQLMARRFA